ncbi:MAG TPA: outer-membrane lipoprotein carrier protein LolA [Rhizomicrobium sp.]|nr:outer-membrane lipoprotein carrier protein LolA [Rhizomicrobium sp.]
MTPRLYRSLAIVIAAALFLFPTAASFAQNTTLSEAQRSDLERVSQAMNAIRSMEGNFVQIGPEGQLDQGRFYIEKPGRMRFEYTNPNPTLIVSDGRWVAVENRKLNTVDRYALWTTPLSLILGDDINLRDNDGIVDVEHRGDQLLVSAREHKSHVNGDLLLVFSEPTLALKQWTVKDAQGLLTTVSVSNVKTGVTLDPSLFTTSAQPKPASNGG